MPRAKPDGFMQAMADQCRWANRALCTDENPMLFDTRTSYGITVVTETNKDAMDICADCPVRLRCLEHAVRHDIRDGVWGGMVAEGRDVWALRNRPDLLPDDRLAVMDPALGPEGPWPAEAHAA